MLEVIIDIILNLFQGFMVTWYLVHCLGTEMNKERVYVTGVGFTFLYLTIQGYYTNFEGIGILIYLGLSILFSCLMLGGTVLKKIVYNIMLIFVLAFSPVIAGNLIGLVISKDFMELISGRSLGYYIAVILNQIILVIFLGIIVKMEEKTRTFLKDKYIMLTLSIPIITIFVCAGVLRIADSGSSRVIYSSIAVIGMFVINVITIVLLMIEQNICQKQAEEAMQMEILQHQKQDVDEINKVYTETEKARHEIKKVMEMTQHLIESGQAERAVDYLKEFQKTGGLYHQNVIYTENAIINHILNRKIEYCKSVNISVKCIVCGSVDGLSDYDIHIILENLIDNAIEAARSVSDGRISIDIYGDSDGIGIKICNSAPKNAIKVNPRMETTKENKKHHGYGVRNVKELIEQNEGTIHYVQLSDDMVLCKVLLLKKKTEQSIS